MIYFRIISLSHALCTYPPSDRIAGLEYLSGIIKAYFLSISHIILSEYQHPQLIRKWMGEYTFFFIDCCINKDIVFIN